MSYNNSVSEKDQSAFPTITVLEVSEDKRLDNDNKRARANCCGCITEQVGFFGLLNTLSSISTLASSDLVSRDEIILIVSVILYAMMSIVGIIGVLAIRKTVI
ncbi:4787_t:CDS:2, partial [Scutellospora calospora]